MAPTLSHPTGRKETKRNYFVCVFKKKTKKHVIYVLDGVSLKRMVMNVNLLDALAENELFLPD